MRTIGLLGGMSWESTASYYRLINEAVRDRLGGLHSARVLLFSVDFEQVAALQRAGDWTAAGEMLADAARALEAAGAGCVIVCTNTMHVVADEIERAVAIPLLHIADATAGAVKAAGHAKVGLLGTRFTMEQDFYRARLEGRHGLEVLVPDADDREAVHRIIFEELCCGRVLPESRERYRQAIARLAARGAQAVVLGCTEISMLVSDADVEVPLFDTMRLHALQAAQWALADDPAPLRAPAYAAVAACA
jgi:aspartate racemase